MSIIYTNHAEYKRNKRKIEQVWIEETIKFPDQIVKAGKKHYATKKLNGRTLEVVYIKEEKHIKVITQYFVS